MQEHDLTARRRKAWRTVFVTAVTVWSLVSILPSLSRLWQPLGDFGFSANGDGLVAAVKPGSAAAAAGIQVGDVIDPRKTRIESRRYIAGLSYALIGARATFAVNHNGVVLRQVTLAAGPETLSSFDKFGLLIRQCTAIVLIVIAASLVLLRPSLVTWAFFFYGVGSNFGSHGVYWSYLPWPALLIDQTVNSAMSAAAYASLLIFVSVLPSGVAVGWRAWLVKAAPFAFVVLLLMSCGPTLSAMLFGAGVEFWNRAGFIVGLTVYAVALVAFVDTYAHSHGEQRQKIRWILLGLVVGQPGIVVASVLENTSLLPLPSYGVLSLLYSTVIFMPLTFGYAIVRHHVVDVNFVISRAVVYAMLTSVVVAVFGLIDWIFTKELSATRLGLFAEMGMAVSLGFWLNGLHKHIDTTVDRVFFRQRYLAARQLARAGVALAHTRNRSKVDEMLVEEPSHALQLASAALFAFTQSGAYRRAYSIGWTDNDARELDEEDAVVLHLKANPAPLDLHEVRWPRSDVPGHAARPGLAVPVTTRGRLVAVLLFGAHANGAALDPDEINMLEHLENYASAAYDHIVAEEKDELNRKLTAQIDALLAAAAR